MCRTRGNALYTSSPSLQIEINVPETGITLMNGHAGKIVSIALEGKVNLIMLFYL